jgi:DNA-directed RNA polymerase subunit omega
LNAELTKKALEKVGNPNVLVNIISKRVRQLNSTAGSGGRPLVANAENLGAADIALTELLSDLLVFEQIPEPAAEAHHTGRRRKS